VIYPGTEIMADVGSHHFVKSSSKSDRVLVPQPSQDPHDPLVRISPIERPGIMVTKRNNRTGTGFGK
jgi:hypothetical protein